MSVCQITLVILPFKKIISDIQDHYKVPTFEDVGIYEGRRKEKIPQQLGRYVMRMLSVSVGKKNPYKNYRKDFGDFYFFKNFYSF